MKDKKVFVTGGAGFIGSNIVKSLLKQGFAVTVYDDFSFGSKKNLKDVIQDIDLIEGDILDVPTLTRSMQGHGIISHQAAQLEIILGEENPYEDLKINTIGTLNVLDVAKKVGSEIFMNASSACIYGQTDHACTENFSPNPNWSYGVSKLAAEKYACVFRDCSSMKIFNLRYAITYGQNEWYRRVLTIFLKRFMEKKPLIIFGKGLQVRDFVHVDDVVNLHNLCIRNPDKEGEYNVGTGFGTDIQDLARLVVQEGKKKLGYTVDIVHEDVEPGKKSKYVNDKIRNPSELKTMLLDPSFAKKSLNWSPQISLEQGIKKQFDWLEENLSSWDIIKYSHEESMSI